jgi:hypothetical protein
MSATVAKPFLGLVRNIMINRITLMRALILVAAMLVGLIAPVHAADDITSAQSTIRSQAEAFGRDDGTAAYAQAAPAIQGMYPSPDIFMEMVRSAFAPVYRHRSFEFGEGQVSGGVIAQKVHIVDTDGVAWEALYTLEQQPYGSFKITSCRLLKAGEAV